MALDPPVPIFRTINEDGIPDLSICVICVICG